MALSNQSLFLYGYVIDANNQNISFATSGAEVPPSTRTAVIPAGEYSLGTLCYAIAAALEAADPLHTYSCTADRSVAGGTQNRVTISTTNTYFGVYFSSGNVNNPAMLLGFYVNDYTGATSYTGYTTSGTVLIPNMIGYSYLPTTALKKTTASQNQSASGVKETIVFNQLLFWQVQFKYIPSSLLSAWENLVLWLTAQNAVDFTPDITQPNTFYSGTLEDPNQGMALDMDEMLPEFPNIYQTPLMRFRIYVE